MSRWSPCKRQEFIRHLRKLGFDGAFSGTRHQFLIYQQQRLTIPSNSEYSVSQLRMMLHEAETIIERTISVEEWNDLG